MSINNTPAYHKTLVSGELNRPWKQNDIYETILNNDEPVYDSINALQVNGKGRTIEIVVNSEKIHTQLLSTGLQIGEETILFRPYNGVFALIKNVPLEATKGDVLELTKALRWQISGPLPISRISPQYDILRDGRAINTGRWICMLDRFPTIKTDVNGKFDFTIRAFGGRVMAFTLSHKRFSPTTDQVDPHNYTQKSGAQGNEGTSENDNNQNNLKNSSAKHTLPPKGNNPADQTTNKKPDTKTVTPPKAKGASSTEGVKQPVPPPPSPPPNNTSTSKPKSIHISNHIDPYPTYPKHFYALDDLLSVQLPLVPISKSKNIQNFKKRPQVPMM